MRQKPTRASPQHDSAYDWARRFGQDLHLCPFCHSGNLAMYMGVIPKVECLNCGAEGPRGQRENYIEDRLRNAIILWNSRTPPERIEYNVKP